MRAAILIVQLALLLARLLLSAVFLLAGLAKFADPQGARQALRNFGLPIVLANLFTLLLPLAEIATAVALVPVASAWYGACAALALLGIFVIVIVIALLRGRAPDCHCFGQLHSAPVGRGTLVRNGLLGALAVWLVLLGPAREGPPLWQHLAAAGDNERRLFIFAACVMAFLIWRALHHKEAEESASVAIDWEDETESEPADDPETTAPRVSTPRAPAPRPQPRDPQLQKILLEGTGWPVGTRAPEFTLPDAVGEKHSLPSLLGQGKTICLVFSSPHCDPCKALWPHLSRWSREHEQALNLIVISRGAAAASQAKQNNMEASRVLLQQGFELSDAYGVTSTPAAVLVGTDGLIHSQLAVGRGDISRLIASLGQASPGSFPLGSKGRQESGSVSA